MKLALDVMGGDYAPVELLAGAMKWLQESEGQIILVGDQEIINEELQNHSYDPSRLEIVHASQVIGMDESPAAALRKKKDASIVVASRLVKDGMADAVVSCGSTGAQMAAAIFILGRMEGIERPPIVAAIPGRGGKPTLLIDVGANVDCRPVQLLQFALLGQAYARGVMNLDNPRVGLLNNGEEEGKGNNLSIQTYELLSGQGGLNFIGNIEGRDLFNNKCDVIVCDGFTGNILLKTLEGMVFFLATGIKEELGTIPKTFASLDYTQIGGAPLLGVNGISVVCHGSSKREAVCNGLNIAADSINNNIVDKQLQELSRLTP
ncbi:MAG: phosphate acyltransferase PlsX [Syntrophomonadaceae bacterium]|jgi:glycerol-3-phosphate acyltransferase PlsX|nr:phosphate acyltransferase PlsX [Syntrophomonadaceae bacterium]